MTSMTTHTDHATTFTKAYNDCAQAKRHEPGRDWKAFLYVVTSLPGLWANVEPCLDYARDTAKLSPGHFGYLSSGEGLLLDVARSLYQGSGQVDLAALASVLDDRTWQVVVDAFHIYRTNKLPPAPPSAADTAAA